VSTHARRHFGDLLELSKKVPVHIQKNGQEVAVVVSAEEYDWLKSHAPARGVSPDIERLFRKSLVKNDAIYRALGRGPGAQFARRSRPTDHPSPYGDG